MHKKFANLGWKFTRTLTECTFLRFAAYYFLELDKRLKICNKKFEVLYNIICQFYIQYKSDVYTRTIQGPHMLTSTYVDSRERLVSTYVDVHICGQKLTTFLYVSTAISLSCSIPNS